MQLKSKTYVAGEQLASYFNTAIQPGEKLYPVNNEDRGIQYKGSKHFRFVFQTCRDGEAHGVPADNRRVCIWYTGGKFEENIFPA